MSVLIGALFLVLVASFAPRAFRRPPPKPPMETELARIQRVRRQLRNQRLRVQCFTKLGD
jgi:hypothetical protein